VHLDPLIVLSAILFGGIAAQWLAWRTRLPAILFLLALGIVAGPVTGVLDPDALFGELLFPGVSLAVAVILFEGALTLRFKDIRGLADVVTKLVTIGALITWAVVSAAAHFIVGLETGLALLFGALVVVTGPTVIVPMLRTVRPTEAVASTLRWEGIVIDPLGALLAVLVFQAVAAGYAEGAGGSVPITFLTTVAAGTAIGWVAGRGLAVALRRHALPEYLHNAVTLAVVAAVFTLSDTLRHESGLLAVTVMGMTMANTRDAPIDDILDFKESLSLLLISVLFVTLAARLDPDRLQALGPSAFLLLLVVMFVARPLAVFVSAFRSKLSLSERALVAWIGPRGIVAAAVSAAFALRLEELGVEEGTVLVPLTFVVIMGTVIVQGLTARPLASLLGITEPEPRGLLVVGAHPLARRIARALQDSGYRVVMADANWESVSEARMAGLSTFYGSPVSEAADRHLDLVGIGRLLALSPSPQLNALACHRYAPEFGGGRVYWMEVGGDNAQRSSRAISRHPGTRLFGEGVNWQKLAAMAASDAEIRRTKLTDAFDFEAWLSKHQEAIPLFALTPEGRLRFFQKELPFEPGPGWTIVSLAPPRAEQEAAAEAEAAPA
jgi:CPA1 family monovalent cation:H+ antiporter